MARPVSFMIALDRFELLHSRGYTSSSKELMTRVVEPGRDLVIFTNNLWHSGGVNPLTQPVYRVFGYMVSDDADFPGTNVFFNTGRELYFPGTRPHSKKMREV